MAGAEEQTGDESAADERPSSELVAERLRAAEADDDAALIHREMEFAAAERLMFFTDAVVAIALTLLALELPVPGGIENLSVSISEMVRDARRHLDDYIAFLISFFVIGAHWRLHHRVFRYVRVASAALISLNMLWLLLIVITPFTTKTLSVDRMNILRFGLYAVTQALQFTIFTMIIVLILRTQHVPAGVDTQRLAGGLWQTVAMAIGFAVSIPLYLLIGQWAFAVWGAAPVVANLAQRQWQRRRAKAT
jgi:TMEM175 potassium channel family protein